MELQEIIEKKTQEYIASDEFNKAIEDKAKSMVNRIVDNVFERWSPISKQIEETVTEALSFDAKSLGLGGYSKVVQQYVEAALSSKFEEDVSSKISQQVEQLLSAAPKIVTVEMLKQKLFEDADTSDYGCGGMTYEDFKEYHDDEDVFTFLVEDSDHGWMSLSIDKEPGKSEYECEFQMSVHSGGSILMHSIGGRELSKGILWNNNYGFGKFFYAMYLADSKIDIEDLRGHL